MSTFIPLSLAVPMIVAAVMVAIAPLLGRRVVDALAIMTAGTVLAMGAMILFRVLRTPMVYWFGGWGPHNGRAIGICFVADPVSGGLVMLVAALVLGAMVFSWRYFEAIGTLYHALMMIFLAAMVGFIWSGDIFNLFVFFELMSAVAYGLTGYKIEEEAALEGAINFAVTNSIGGLFILMGIGLLYGRAGALNMAQIGRILAGKPPDELVICAFTFITTGFLVKGAMLPFHFWLSDAHAVAPSPVCVLFSGVMVPLGLYGVVRVYWTMFAGVPGFASAVHALVLALGVSTAIVGAVMCFLQRHLKRLLAFSTISHMGLFASGFALLTPDALAGTGIYLIGHGLIKGALFMCSGIVLHKAQSVDEIELALRPVRSPFTMAIYALAALGLAGFPPFCLATGKSLIEEAAQGWQAELVTVVMVATSALTGAAVLRAGGRIFLGWGKVVGEERGAPTERKTEPETQFSFALPPVMLAPAAALIAFALFLGLIPSFPSHAIAASAWAENRAAYAAMVLNGRALNGASALVNPHLSWTSGYISGGFALLIALNALFGAGLPRVVARIVDRAVRVLHDIHSGRIGDYVTWLVVGVAVFGLVLTALVG